MRSRACRQGARGSSALLNALLHLTAGAESHSPPTPAIGQMGRFCRPIVPRIVPLETPMPEDPEVTGPNRAEPLDLQHLEKHGEAEARRGDPISIRPSVGRQHCRDPVDAREARARRLTRLRARMAAQTSQKARCRPPPTSSDGEDQGLAARITPSGPMFRMVAKTSSSRPRTPFRIELAHVRDGLLDDLAAHPHGTDEAPVLMDLPVLPPDRVPQVHCLAHVSLFGL